MSPKEVDKKFDRCWPEDEVGIEFNIKECLNESSKRMLN